MKSIIILNGAGKKNGNTAAMIRAFSDAAKANGNEIKEFYLQTMNIHGCLDCGGCHRSERQEKLRKRRKRSPQSRKRRAATSSPTPASVAAPARTRVPAAAFPLMTSPA